MLRKQGTTLEAERRISISNAHLTNDWRVTKEVRGEEMNMEWKR